MSEFKGTPMDQLKKLMEKLRHPTEGCPWDREQTFETVAPYTIEEAYFTINVLGSGLSLSFYFKFQYVIIRQCISTKTYLFSFPLASSGNSIKPSALTVGLDVADIAL